MPLPFPTVQDAFLSLFQSAAAALARQRGDADHPMLSAAAHLAAVRHNPTRAYAPPGNLAVPSIACAELGLHYLEAVVRGDAAQRQALAERLRFSSCDPLWAETLAAYAGSLGPDGKPRPVPYVRHAALDDFVVAAPQAALRVALFSDWGTGTQTARQVAALMARQQPDIAIHLGDIYYSGTREECDQHFLAPLRAALPGAQLFTLCGNHDTYSGGAGYYGLLREIGQPASYFCLRSPDRSWQILGADTGLHDRDPFGEAARLTQLDPAEEEWHADKLRGFPGRTILLSHHQPFSAYAQVGPLSAHSPVNPNLMASSARLAEAGRIDAWFWGHEHRLRIYAPYRGITAGRNIGYGAIPVEAAPGPHETLPGLQDPPALKVDLRLDVVDGADTHGFALLELGGPAIGASYWALTRPDAPIWRETIGDSA